MKRIVEVGLLGPICSQKQEHQSKCLGISVDEDFTFNHFLLGQIRTECFRKSRIGSRQQKVLVDGEVLLATYVEFNDRRVFFLDWRLR